jgi:hypothetical protein
MRNTDEMDDDTYVPEEDEEEALEQPVREMPVRVPKRVRQTQPTSLVNKVRRVQPTSPLHQKKDPLPLEEMPIVKMRIAEIAAHMRGCIMEQDAAMDELASQLLLCRSKHRSHTQKNIAVVHATGGTGVGKTTAIERARPLFLMERGQYYERQFVRVLLSAMGDDTHLTHFTGAGKGYAGYGEDTLVTDLVRAQQRVDPDMANPLIVVLFDELDKTKAEVMNYLNPLTQDGELRGTSGEHFVLDPDTLLFLYFTSNFAEDVIDMDDLDTTYQQTELKMQLHGLQPCDIRRLGQFVLFPPFTLPQIRRIVPHGFEQRCVASHCFSQTYGTPRNATPQAVDLLLERVIASYDPRFGVARPRQAYDGEFTHFLMRALCVFENDLPIEEEGPLHPYYTYRTLAPEEITLAMGQSASNASRIKAQLRMGGSSIAAIQMASDRIPGLVAYHVLSSTSRSTPAVRSQPLLTQETRCMDCAKQRPMNAFLSQKKVGSDVVTLRHKRCVVCRML